MSITEAKKFIRWLVVRVFLVWVLLQAGYAALSIGLDDSDSNDMRSGMKVHVDHATHCEYLSSPSGGITPRMTVRGQQRGCI